MTDDTKTAFLTAVVGLQGGKAVEVLSHMASRSPEALESFHPDLPDELVREGKLVEVEYTLPTMAYKVKSFFLPAGTVVRVRFRDRDVLAVPSPKPGDPDYDPKNDPDA